MRQAIVTRYIGPTNSMGPRVRAKAQAGSIMVPWDHAIDVDDNHTAAAEALADKFGWLDRGSKLVGALPDGTVAHVLVGRVR